MPNYTRLFIEGGTYFFTVNLADRRSSLLTDEIASLRASWADVLATHPFETIAVSILHEHMHFIWRLPEGDHDFPTRIRLIKSGFTRRLAPSLKSSGRKGERKVWQPRYWEHLIRDDRDFDNHVAYVLWNPVKHGLVQQPGDWPYSSWRSWIRDHEVAMPPADWVPKHLGER